MNIERREAIISLVINAGDMIMRSWDNGNLISEKGKFDYVTELDVKVQNYLVEGLKEIDSSYEFIAEENGLNAKKFDNVWIIDPIDGTTNYIHRYPYFAVCMAYFEQGEAIFSIIYNPASNEMFLAQKGNGAYLNGKRINVSSRNELKQAMI